MQMSKIAKTTVRKTDVTLILDVINTTVSELLIFNETVVHKPFVF